MPPIGGPGDDASREITWSKDKISCFSLGCFAASACRPRYASRQCRTVLPAACTLNATMVHQAAWYCHNDNHYNSISTEVSGCGSIPWKQSHLGWHTSISLFSDNRRMSEAGNFRGRAHVQDCMDSQSAKKYLIRHFVSSPETAISAGVGSKR